MELTAGSIVDRYRIDGPIGAGSMGDVLRATDIGLNRPVALKILSRRHRDNKELRARFLREGRAVASISHPNVVQVFSTGSYDSRPYIAMELLHGVDLGSTVDEAGAIPSAHAAQALLDSARGLEAAANAGLIHRDVKPSNLVLLEDGIVKVTDFGLAKPIEPADEPSLTALGVVVGTPDYIAPEQARGDKIDQRVDIYSLGGTLHFLVTARPPYRTGRKIDDAYLKVVARHLNQAVPDPRHLQANIDDELASLGMAMMAKEPAQRPTYSILIATLERIINRLQGDLSKPVSLTMNPAIKHPTISAPQIEKKAEHRSNSSASHPQYSNVDDGTWSHDSHLNLEHSSSKPRRWVWLIGLIVCTALAIVATTYMRSSGHADVQSPSATSDKKTNLTNSPLKSTSTLSNIVVPDNMILVSKPDGSPWFLVLQNPVSLRELRDFFPHHAPKQSKKKDKLDATGVRYSRAESYASAHDMTLPTKEQLKAAFMGGIHSSKNWEWVRSDTTKEKYDVVKLNKNAKRAPKGHSDVTFRMVREL